MGCWRNKREGKQVQHVNSKAGNYTVTQAVTDNDWLQNSIAEMIKVATQPSCRPDGDIACTWESEWSSEHRRCYGDIAKGPVADGVMSEYRFLITNTNRDTRFSCQF